MKIKQRICGFIGHKSEPYFGDDSGEPFSVKLKCSKCAYETKWFNTPSKMSQCKGENCNSTDGINHSKECIAEHQKTINL